MSENKVPVGSKIEIRQAKVGETVWSHAECKFFTVNAPADWPLAVLVPDNPYGVHLKDVPIPDGEELIGALDRAYWPVLKGDRVLDTDGFVREVTEDWKPGEWRLHLRRLPRKWIVEMECDGVLVSEASPFLPARATILFAHASFSGTVVAVREAK